MIEFQYQESEEHRALASAGVNAGRIATCSREYHI